MYLHENEGQVAQTIWLSEINEVASNIIDKFKNIIKMSFMMSLVLNLSHFDLKTQLLSYLNFILLRFFHILLHILNKKKKTSHSCECNEYFVLV